MEGFYTTPVFISQGFFEKQWPQKDTESTKNIYSFIL